MSNKTHPWGESVEGITINRLVSDIFLKCLMALE